MFPLPEQPWHKARGPARPVPVGKERGLRRRGDAA